MEGRKGERWEGKGGVEMGREGWGRWWEGRGKMERERWRGRDGEGGKASEEVGNARQEREREVGTLSK